MTTQYPDGIDGDTQIPITTDLVTPVKAVVINTLRGAIFAIEQELGIQPSREFATVRQRLDAMSAIIDALQAGSGSGNANLTTLPPVPVTKSAAQVGVVQLAALSDHKHDVSTSSATSISNINSEGSSTFLARADHTHAVTGFNISGQVQGSILYYNGTNWVQLNPSTDGFTLTTHGSGNNPTWAQSTGVALSTTSPTVVDKNTSTVGVGTTAARSDHHHQASTATAISITNTNSEGTSLSLARSDHTHQLGGVVGGDLSGTLPNPTVSNFHIAGATQGAVLYYNGTAWVVLNPGTDGYVLTTHNAGNNPSWTQVSGGGTSLTTNAPLNVDNTAAAVGVAITAARGDHKHAINFGTPVSIGTINSAGTASTLALSDHTHLVNAFNISGQTTGDLLQFNGTAWVRLPASTSGTVLTANGVSALPTWTAIPAGLSLTSAAPVNVDKAAAIVGVATQAARADHKHSVNTAAAITVGTVNAEGVATTLARSDHTHLVSGLSIAGQTTGDLLVFNGTAWTRLADSTAGLILTANGVGTIPSWQAAASGVTLATLAPLDVDANVAAVGTGTTAARQDHKHNISTAIAISIGATNAQGVATSLARSDHTHQVIDLKITSQLQGNILYFNGTNWVVLANGTAGQVLTTNGVSANPTWTSTTILSAVAPVNVDGNTAAVGVATTAARSDHKHNVNFGTPISIGATNAQGTAVTLARSDHTHSVTDLSISGETRGDVLYYNGTNWVRLPAGQDGYVLTTHGTIANPTWNIVTGGGGGAISSVFTRTGAIVAVSGDYTSTLITNLSSVAGANVTLALNNLLTSINALPVLSNVAPVNVNTNVATQGVATTAARSDHKHNIDVAAAVSIGAVNGAGVATSLARSDHTHQVTDLHMTSQVQGNVLYFNGTNWVVLAPGTSGQALTSGGAAANPTWASIASLSSSAPVNVNGTAAAVGVATTAARSDHKHNVDFGTPIAIGTALSAGTATTLVRSDHVHTVAASVVVNDSSVTGTHVSDALNTLRTSAGIVDTSSAGGSTVLASLNNIIIDINNLGTDDIANNSSIPVSTATNALDNLLLQYPSGFYNIGASFTLSNTNNGMLGLINANVTCTIPTLASSGIPRGSKFQFIKYTSGAILVVAGAGGVNVHSSAGTFTVQQYTKYTLECIAVDEWTVREEYIDLNSDVIVNNSTANGFTLSSTLSYLNSKSFNGVMTQSPVAIVHDNSWTFFSTQGWVGGGLGEFINFAIIPAPAGTIITHVSINFKPSSHTSLPSIMPVIILFAANPGANATAIQTVTDPSSTVSAYNAFHSITMSGLSIPAGQPLWLNFQDEAGTHAAGGIQIYQIAITYN